MYRHFKQSTEADFSQGGKTYPRALFACILIMLVPVIIKSTVYPSANYTALMAAAFVMQCAVVIFTFGKRWRLIPSPIIMILMINAIVAMMSNSLHLRSIDSQDFINLAAKMLCIFLFYEGAKNLSLSSAQLKQYARLMAGLSVVACLYNIFVNVSAIPAVFSSVSSSYLLSFKSFFLNRNQFGMFLVVSMVLTEYAYAGQNVKRKAWIHFLQIMNIVLTLSRGSMAAMLVFLAARCFLPSNKKNMVLKSIAILLLATVALICVFHVPLLYDYIFEDIFRVDVGLTGRPEIWKMGYDAASQNWINGVGTFTGIRMAREHGFAFDQFHSFFVDTFVSGGLVELCTMLFLHLSVYRRCVKKMADEEIRSTYRASFYALLCMGVFESVSFFSIGYVDTFFTINYIMLPMMLSNHTWEKPLPSIRQSHDIGSPQIVAEGQRF